MIQVDAETLTAGMSKYIQDKRYADSVRSELAQIQHKLGDRGGTARVAQALEKYLS